jgi:hypothetical protein
MGTLKVDKIVSTTGDATSAPITLSGDTATLGTGVTIPAAGITGTLGSGVTGAGLYASIAIICDQKAKNDPSGTFTADNTAGTHPWRTRDLNTELSDVDGIVSISSNQFTLAAGTYQIDWNAPAYSVDTHASRLYNITDTSEVQVSQTGSANKYNAAANQQNSVGICIFTITGSKAFEIQHRCQTTHATDGFGIRANYIYPTDTAPVSIYTMVTIRKYR